MHLPLDIQAQELPCVRRLEHGNPETEDLALAGGAAGPGAAERRGLAGREPYKVQDPMETWPTTGHTDG